MKFLNASETKFHYGLNNLDRPAIWMGIDPNELRDNWTFYVDEDGKVIFAEGGETSDFVTITALGIFPIVPDVLNIGSSALPFKDLYLSGSIFLTEDTSKVNIDAKQIIQERGNNILVPSGGGTVDTQARSSISQILNALKVHGIIASS